MAPAPNERAGAHASTTLAANDSNGRELSRRARAIGTLLWASFLAAGVGTMFFFAFIAPDDLIGKVALSNRIDHIGVYTLGFFGLWILSALASALTLYVHGQLDAGPDPKS
jgi:polyferredoxin